MSESFIIEKLMFSLDIAAHNGCSPVRMVHHIVHDVAEYTHTERVLPGEIWLLFPPFVMYVPIITLVND